MNRNILFLCVANSARSQIAEGLARDIAPADCSVHSAGSQPAVLNPLAAQALTEVGIDPHGQRAKGLADVPLADMDAVITLCEDEVCPPLPEHVQRLHWPMPDPAVAEGSEAQRLQAFRDVRDRIRSRLEEWFDAAVG